MTTMARSFVSASSRKEIEHVIADLYAAGLDLQTSASSDVPAGLRAMIPGCVRRIADLIEDLREAADGPSVRTA